MPPLTDTTLSCRVCRPVRNMACHFGLSTVWVGRMRRASAWFNVRSAATASLRRIAPTPAGSQAAKPNRQGPTLRRGRNRRGRDSGGGTNCDYNQSVAFHRKSTRPAAGVSSHDVDGSYPALWPVRVRRTEQGGRRGLRGKAQASSSDAVLALPRTRCHRTANVRRGARAAALSSGAGIARKKRGTWT